MHITPAQTVIITGGNSGLGYHTARKLAQTQGWHIVIASHNPQRTAAGVVRLKRETNYPHIHAMTLDLAHLQAVRDFAAAFTARDDLPPLKVLVCNAGLHLMHDAHSRDGFELTFAVNHLGHFLLAHLLLRHLQTHAAAHAPARIIFVSSGTHIPRQHSGGMPGPKYVNAQALAYPDEAAAADRIDDPIQRYPTSKLCNVLCTYELARRLENEAISTPDAPINVFAFDPGLMPGTRLIRDASAGFALIFKGVVRLLEPFVPAIHRPVVSGANLARLVTDPALTGLNTGYFDATGPTRSSDDSYNAALALDLWQTSIALTRLQPIETPLHV